MPPGRRWGRAGLRRRRAAPRRIVDEPERSQWRCGGFALELFATGGELLRQPHRAHPKVFVLWRMDGELARPATVSVSYGETARWLDSGEQVDGVAMPREIADWGATVNTHYQPEPKKVKRNDPLRAGPEDGREPRLSLALVAAQAARGSARPSNCGAAGSGAAAPHARSGSAPLAPATPDAAADAAGGAEAQLPAGRGLSLSRFHRLPEGRGERGAASQGLQKLFSGPALQSHGRAGHLHRRLLQPDPIPPEILAKLQHAREWLMDDATARSRLPRWGDGAVGRSARRPASGDGEPTAEPAGARRSARLRKLATAQMRVGDASTICRARCRRSRRKSRDKTHPERQIVASIRDKGDIAQSWLFGDSCGLPCGPRLGYELLCVRESMEEHMSERRDPTSPYPPVRLQPQLRARRRAMLRHGTPRMQCHHALCGAELPALQTSLAGGRPCMSPVRRKPRSRRARGGKPARASASASSTCASTPAGRPSPRRRPQTRRADRGG